MVVSKIQRRMSLLQRCLELEQRILQLLRSSKADENNNTRAILISRELRENLVKVLERPREERDVREIERRLWKTCFYVFINMFRKDLASISEANDSNMVEAKLDQFDTFLDEAKRFYEKLAKRNVSVNSEYRSLVYLGDIARYKQLHSRKYRGNKMTKTRFAEAEEYYKRALKLETSFGSAHNQLAVLATYRDANIVATYHYVRALYSRTPFRTALSNLRTIFSRTMSKNKSTHVPKKTSKLQRCMQRFLDMNSSLFFAAESGSKKVVPDAKLLLATRNRLRRRFEELLELQEKDDSSSSSSSSRDRVQTVVSTSAFLDQLMTISMFTHRQCREAWKNSSFTNRPGLEIVFAHTHISMSDIATCAARKICDIESKKKNNNNNYTKRLRVARRHLLRTCRLYCQWLSADVMSRFSPKIFSRDGDVSNKNVASLVDALYDSQSQWWTALCDLTNTLITETASEIEEVSSSERTTMSSSSSSNTSTTKTTSWTFHNLTLLDRIIDNTDEEENQNRSLKTITPQRGSNALAIRVQRIQGQHAKEIVRFAAKLTTSIVGLPRKLFVWRTKSGSPRLTSKLSVDQQQYNTTTTSASDTSTATVEPSPIVVSVPTRKRKLNLLQNDSIAAAEEEVVVVVDENKKPRLLLSSFNTTELSQVQRARHFVQQNQITTNKLKEICDSNPSDVIFRAAYEHAKEKLRNSNFDLCQLESVRRTRSI